MTLVVSDYFLTVVGA